MSTEAPDVTTAPDVRTPGPGFRVLLTMTVRAGREAEFETAWRTVAESVTARPGNAGHWLMRDAADPSVYYLGSDWSDEAAFRAFERDGSAAGPGAHRDLFQPLRTSGSIATMHVIGYTSRRPGEA
ncbi:hypothetical protein BSZ07_15195 [Streptomyces sp. M1013]|nr:hypothetical protein BSZ07_15195 [Streptomyces sp. M1013]